MSTAGRTPTTDGPRGTGTPGGPSLLRRYRSPLVVVGAVAVVVGGLAVAGNAGDDEEYDYDAVCVDDSDTRVDDQRCDGADENGSHGSGGGHWYFIPVGGLFPRIGGRATGGSPLLPDPARFSVHRGGADPAGGTVSRGGFGGRGEGSVGG